MTMETDRELLEWAAKAAELPYDAESFVAAGEIPGEERWGMVESLYVFWNPITDDGDTFRLETKMSFTVVFWAEGVEVGEFEFVKKELRAVIGKSAYETYSCHGGDKNAARRKAATRAAAKIGREMP